MLDRAVDEEVAALAAQGRQALLQVLAVLITPLQHVFMLHHRSLYKVKHLTLHGDRPLLTAVVLVYNDIVMRW
jgi:hypothetical protein